MSYHEGSNWQARKEDNKEPLYKNEERKKTSLVSLEELPAGSLFYYNNTLCLKTEYKSEGGAIEAFIVGSGEMFWGGTKDAASQRKLMISPVSNPGAVAQSTPTPPGIVEQINIEKAKIKMLEDMKEWAEGSMDKDATGDEILYSHNDFFADCDTWIKRCNDTLARIIEETNPGEERRLQRQEDNNEHLGKCLQMLKFLYMADYCGEHGNEVRDLIMPRPQPKVEGENGKEQKKESYEGLDDNK
jgi:hypothetical protein